MVLRIAYRSAAAGNDKPRPPYFSKGLALQSLLRAVERLPEPPVLTFYNDGELPEAHVAVMREHGTVRPLRAGSNRQSFRATVAAEAAAAGPDDLVWFAEDDYLYSPEALTALLRAADAIPEADYLAMYGSAAIAPSAGRTAARRAGSGIGADGDPDARDLDGVLWYRAFATTSTFGVRGRALRADATLLRAYPYCGGAWDEATCLALQGYRPFGLAGLLPGDGAPLPRALVRAAIRAVADVRALRRPANRRVLVACDPELVWHMEELDGTTRSAPSARTEAVDRAAIAAETAAWSRNGVVDGARRAG